MGDLEEEAVDGVVEEDRVEEGDLGDLLRPG
jgi:hypothetical protein